MFTIQPTQRHSRSHNLRLAAFFCVAASVGTLTGCAAPKAAPLVPSAAAQLAAWQDAPETAGELVYRGTTYALSPPGTAPLFRYTRRVRSTGDGATATHLTQSPAGELRIAEVANFGPGYRLRRFEVINQQQGFSGSATVSADGRQLVFHA